MAGIKYPKILFFIAGMAPTSEEVEKSLNIGVVAFRNVSMIGPRDNPEKCDAVAGDLIPAAYDGKPVIKSMNDANKLMRDLTKAANAPLFEALRSNVGTESPLGEKAPKGQGGPASAGWSPNA